MNDLLSACLYKKRLSSSLRALAALLLLPGVLAAAQAQEAGTSAASLSSRGFMDPAGPVAAAQLSHFGTISLIMLVVVIIPIFIAIPIILLRYRRGARGAYKPDWEFNWGVELFIWALPIMIIIALGIALWNHTHKYDPYAPLGENPLQIQVVSLDWKFLFLYPEQGIATVNLLALPEKRPVTLTLTSGTVMQSFMVPRLAGQIYTMAGMSTKLNLIADKPGTYVGRNMQYNGTGFASQSFGTKVMTDDAFAAWAEKTRTASGQLDWQGYETLLKPSIVNEPVLYSSFDPDLFNKIIASFAPEQHKMASTHNKHHGHHQAEANQ
jgi:cytochrome o ubiquinol oxidase subunit 2|tara:strand:- start:33779 stop:34750 length:972 start_codon:yes stop_codon:yes gene_type:complete